jgi:Asp-tRNA(Asn)/Glu-tRNA(Gln) amidotransferase C subunit
MNINEALLEKLCALAYLKLKDSEKRSLLKSLNDLVHDFSKIKEVESFQSNSDL